MKGRPIMKKREPGRGRENDDFSTFFSTDKKGESRRAGEGGQAPLNAFDAWNSQSLLSLRTFAMSLFARPFPGDGRIENACGGRPAITLMLSSVYDKKIERHRERDTDRERKWKVSVGKQSILFSLQLYSSVGYSFLLCLLTRCFA